MPKPKARLAVTSSVSDRAKKFQENWEVKEVSRFQNAPKNSIIVQTLRSRKEEDKAPEPQIGILKWIESDRYNGPGSAVTFNAELAQDIIFAILKAVDDLEFDSADIARNIAVEFGE